MLIALALAAAAPMPAMPGHIMRTEIVGQIDPFEVDKAKADYIIASNYAEQQIKAGKIADVAGLRAALATAKGLLAKITAAGDRGDVAAFKAAHKPFRAQYRLILAHIR